MILEGDPMAEEASMESITRTLRINGHTVAVINSMEEDGAAYLISVDDVVINADAPLPGPPTDREVGAVVRRWTDRT
jgi:hypothetical protein